MEDKKFKYKKNLFIVLFLSLIVGEVCYIFFSFQKPIYQATGKFSYYYQTTTGGGTAVVPYTSDTLTKSLAESIVTRSFVEDLMRNANVQSKDSSANNPDKIIQAKVLPGSNIVEVSVFDADKSTLDKISKAVFQTIEGTAFVSNQNTKAQIQVVDPPYVSPNPYYPKPLNYALIACASLLVVGLMLIYDFSLNN